MCRPRRFGSFARVAALAVLVAACSPARSTSSPGASPTLSPSSTVAASVAPTMATTPTPSPSLVPPTPAADSACPSWSTDTAPAHVFPTVAIPAGADFCQAIGGSFCNPCINSIANDGPTVAMATQSGLNVWTLWLGDIRTGSIKPVYTAPKSADHWTEIGRPRLAGGHLLWMDWSYPQNDGVMTSTSESQSLEAMDLATGKISVLSTTARLLDFDGRRVALLSYPTPGHEQIELRDLAGNSIARVPISRDLMDFAFVRDGFLYLTAAALDLEATGPLILYHWTKAGGSREIGRDVTGVSAQGDLAAWVDEISEPDHNAAHLHAAAAPFTSARQISHSGAQHVDRFSCGSGTVAWFEGENEAIGDDLLAVWRPGWSTPVQVATTSGLEDLSTGGGWLTWTEYVGVASSDGQRVHGLPISVLAP